MSPMDPSGLLFSGSLQPSEPNFPWGTPSSCLYNVKSEAAVLPGLSLNTASSPESCLANTCQGINQRTYTYFTSLAPLSSNESFPAIASDSAGLGDLNHAQSVKCDYSTVTSAQRDESFLNQMQIESLAIRYSPNVSGTAGWNSALSQSSSMCGDLQSMVPAESLRGVLQPAPAPILGGASSALKIEALPPRDMPVARRTVSGQAFRHGFTPEVSEDASLDGLRPSSSTVSSTTGSLGPDQDDDDVVCTTSSTEPAQFVKVSSPGVGGTGMVRSPQSDEQQTSSEGGSVLAADQAEMDSPRSIILGPHMVHNRGTLGVGDESWCTKVKEGSSVGLCFADPGPNLMNGGAANATPPADPAAASYLRRNNPNIYRMHNNIHTLATLDIATNALTTNKPASSVAIAEDNLMRDSMTHAMMFRSAFPTAIDLAAVENSRPKRRNVKISKDPQSVAARHRRERISDRIRVLQRLVPGGTKMDTASMLDEAIHYVKFLKEQVQTLETVSNAAAAFDPVGRLGFPPGSFFRNSGLPFRQVSNDPLGLSAAAEHGLYGSGSPFLSHPSADAFREQFCH